MFFESVIPYKKPEEFRFEPCFCNRQGENADFSLFPKGKRGEGGGSIYWGRRPRGLLRHAVARFALTRDAVLITIIRRNPALAMGVAALSFTNAATHTHTNNL